MSLFRHPFWNSVVSFRKRPSSLPVADEKRVYKTIPAIVSTEASGYSKIQKRNNDNGNGLEIPEIKKKLRSEIQIKTFESVGRRDTCIFFNVA